MRENKLRTIAFVLQKMFLKVIALNYLIVIPTQMTK